ncbi:MAG: hypothetical protein ACTSUB_09655, partial [Candidatus Thorarchaeota archaeon]
RKRKMTWKRFRNRTQRTSWSTFTSIWQGRERPVTPWTDGNYPPRSLRKKHRVPRELRKHHY